MKWVKAEVWLANAGHAAASLRRLRLGGDQHFLDGRIEPKFLRLFEGCDGRLPVFSLEGSLTATLRVETAGLVDLLFDLLAGRRRKPRQHLLVNPYGLVEVLNLQLMVAITNQSG